MNLDNVTVELRPRSEWEAADLGARMVRRDAKVIYQTWFAVTLPLFLLAALTILFTPWSGWAFFAYWWLEPLTDGMILYIISRRLFGERVGALETLRQLPRITRQNLIFLLPPYRFHLARNIAIPVTQLEGLSGKRRRARAKVLNTRIVNFGIGVTTAYQHLILALYFGAAVLIYLLIPLDYQAEIARGWFADFYNLDSRLVSIGQLCLFYFAQSVLHPWFVGAGFGLYINCRTRLEAWDIEVSFRRMVKRRNLGTAALVCLLLPLLADRPLLADSEEEITATEPSLEDPAGKEYIGGYWRDEEVAAALTEVYAMEALQTEEEVEVWKSKNRQEEETEEESTTNTDWAFLESLANGLAFLVEIWLWLLVAALLLLLYATRDMWLPFLDTRAPTKSRRRVILESGEISAESLPPNVPTEARRLWEQGQRREALSLLFRGSVFYLVTEHDVAVPPSATEGDCLDAVAAQSSGESAAYFKQVVLAWVLCAYGSRDPDDRTVQTLCDDWANHYGGALE